MKKILYTMGDPECEQEAIRQLIAKEGGMDTRGLKLYNLSAKDNYGRVYYGVFDAKTETGLLFTLFHLPRAEAGPELYSEWEIAKLFKTAKALGLWNFRMLPPIRVFEEEIRALTGEVCVS